MQLKKSRQLPAGGFVANDCGKSDAATAPTKEVIGSGSGSPAAAALDFRSSARCSPVYCTGWLASGGREQFLESVERLARDDDVMATVETRAGRARLSRTTGLGVRESIDPNVI